MKGILKTTVILLLAAMPLSVAGDDLSSTEFREIIREIHQINRVDPRIATGFHGSAEAYVEKSDKLIDRVWLAAALAPFEAISRGYQETRRDMLRLVVTSSQSPEATYLVPYMRVFIADLAVRYGDFEFAFHQLLDAVHWVEPDTPRYIRLRLLELAVRLNLDAGYPFDALFIINQIGEMGGFVDRRAEARFELLKSEAYGAAGDLASMATVLDELAFGFTGDTDQSTIDSYWIQKTWHALLVSSKSRAREYLETTRELGGRMTSGLQKADVLLLDAILLQLENAPEEVVATRLEEARNAYIAVGFPVRYAELVHRFLHIPNTGFLASSSTPFLHALQDVSFRGENRLAEVWALAATIELQRRAEGDIPAHVIFRLQLLVRKLEEFRRDFGALQVEWARFSGVLFNPTVDQTDAQGDDYLLMLVLILIVVMLVLILRIRMQRHMNLKLADSYRKARQAELLAEESNKLKSQFLANVSHEIKTPMSGLVGMASLLDELVTDPRQRQYLSTIRTCSQNLLVLMNDLLDLGRIESGKLEIEPVPFDVRKGVDYCRKIVEEPASKKGLELITHVDSGVPDTVLGDSTRIGQIMTNLLQNAIKFTDRGTVSLRVGYEKPEKQEEGRLTIRVADTGIGIPGDKLQAVFEPFNRIEGHRERGLGGSGLGLAICKKLVDLMGGTIGVESDLSEGSIFTVTLPVGCQDSAH